MSKFTYLPTFYFGNGFKGSQFFDKFSTPGPGSYNPNKEPELKRNPQWKIMGPSNCSRKNPLNYSTQTLTLDYEKEYNFSSKKPQAPKYSFGKFSGVIPRKGKKYKPGERPQSVQPKTNKNTFKFSESNFQGDNAALPQENNENFNSENIQKPKSKKKKKKEKKDEDYAQDDGTTPGVGRYNIRSSLKVPVTKFGTERKDIAYKDTPSRGPASYNIRPEFGKDAIKVNFGKDEKLKNINTSCTPGPIYETIGKLGDNAPKISFPKEGRMEGDKILKNKKGEIIPHFTQSSFPGPDKYEIRKEFGSDAKKITISPYGRPDIVYNSFPGPNKYHPNYKVTKRRYPTYRIGTAKRKQLYESDDNFPAPNYYTVNEFYSSKRPKTPSWKIGTGKRPKLYLSNNNPGVGKYTLRNDKNDGPKYTLRGKYKIVSGKMKVPGVGKYNIDTNYLYKTDPSWKIGTSKRDDELKRIKRENFPSAAAYSPIVKRRHSNNIKFGKEKRMKYKDNENPAPNAYHIPCSIVDVNDYTREQGDFDENFRYI